MSNHKMQKLMTLIVMLVVLIVVNHFKTLPVEAFIAFILYAFLKLVVQTA